MALPTRRAGRATRNNNTSTAGKTRAPQATRGVRAIINAVKDGLKASTDPDQMLKEVQAKLRDLAQERRTKAAATRGLSAAKGGKGKGDKPAKGGRKRTVSARSTTASPTRRTTRRNSIAATTSGTPRRTRRAPSSESSIANNSVDTGNDAISAI